MDKPDLPNQIGPNAIKVDLNYDIHFQPNIDFEEIDIKHSGSFNDGIIVMEEDHEEKMNKDNSKEVLSSKKEKSTILNNNIENNSYSNKPNSNLNNNIIEEEDKLHDILHDKVYNNMVFLFVNPASGSKEGQNIINMGVKKVEFIDTYKCSAFIFNVLDRTNYLEGVSLLRQYQLQCLTIPKSHPRVIIGGGDGTVLSIIEDFLTQGINVQNCLFGVLPLGTGNDLSCSLGWGCNIYFNIFSHD